MNQHRTGRPRILVDAAIHDPQVFNAFGEVTALPGAELGSSDLRGVTALITRTVTKVDAELLSRAPDLRFVGSASAGTDHVDKMALDEAGVGFAHAPGCNAQAVAEWVFAAMLRAGVLQLEGSRVRPAHPGDTIGIVGAGATGSALRDLLFGLGVPCLSCDPAKHAAGLLPEHRSFERLREQCAALSFHVPLVRGGPHPTWRMFDAVDVQTWLRAGKSLVNASRGEVLALPSAEAAAGLAGRLILDVWPGEPELDWAWLSPAQRPACLRVATPHIAGYSGRGKQRATQMVVDALAEAWEMPTVSVAGGPRNATASQMPHGEGLASAIERVAGLARDEAALCAVGEGEGPGRADAWRTLRSSYPLRAEFGQLRANPAWDPGLSKSLGFLPA